MLLSGNVSQSDFRDAASPAAASMSRLPNAVEALYGDPLSHQNEASGAAPVMLGHSRLAHRAVPEWKLGHSPYFEIKSSTPTDLRGKIEGTLVGMHDPYNTHFHNLMLEAVNVFIEHLPDQTRFQNATVILKHQHCRYGGESTGAPNLHMDGLAPSNQKPLRAGLRVPQLIMATPFPTPTFPGVTVRDMKTRFKHRPEVGYQSLPNYDTPFDVVAPAPGQYAFLPELTAHATPSTKAMPRSYEEAEAMFSDRPEIMAFFGQKGYDRHFVTVYGNMTPLNITAAPLSQPPGRRL